MPPLRSLGIAGVLIMCGLRPQGLLGRKHLEHVLQRAGLLPEGTALQTAYPAVRTAPGLIACLGR
jgi:hypothetical protein